MISADSCFFDAIYEQQVSTEFVPYTTQRMDVGELFAKDSNVKGARGHFLKLEKLGCVRY